MEAEDVSLFETTETMASFLCATPLLTESWKLCSAANATASPPPAGLGFVVEQVGPVGYMAFSGTQMVPAGSDSDLYSQEMVPLTSTISGHGGSGGPFSGSEWLDRGDGDDEEGEEDEPVMVHKGLLQLFFTMFIIPVFQIQLRAIRERSKSIVLTGHSIGGSTASLMALWLLGDLETNTCPPTQLLCITFGSPIIGNKSLSKALLRQRWAGNFCHVVLKHDIVPRLLFAPLASSSTSFNAHLHCLHQYWQPSMASPQLGRVAYQMMPEEEKSRFLRFALPYTEKRTNTATDKLGKRLFTPFGSYLFCSEEGGAICVDNSEAVVKLLHLMLAEASPTSCFQDHLGYGDCVRRVSWQLLKSRGLMRESVGKSGYEVGIEMALESVGLTRQDLITENAKCCLKMAKKMGPTPNLNSAKLAISLSKVTPYRAQIEWYKASCDESDDKLGYYDSFKQKQASRREFQVNMFRLKLAQFWNDIIAKIDSNQLPHDFLKQRAKWVNAAHFYQLLVEPLDIAQYYRTGMHLSKGHYLEHGRERRHRMIDKWWRGRKLGEEENHKRSKFAGLTEDSCFWAKVEEARELLDKVRRRGRNSTEMWKAIVSFEQDARELVENKKVSQDVLARNSSYSLWVEELREVRSQLQQFPPQASDFLGW